jgi:hypothetical protein
VERLQRRAGAIAHIDYLPAPITEQGLGPELVGEDFAAHVSVVGRGYHIPSQHCLTLQLVCLIHRNPRDYQ